MGIFQEIKCPSCHATWEIRTGHGRMHGMINRVLEAFPAGMQEKIREDLGGQTAPLFDFNYRMAACSHCRAIVAVPLLRFPETGQSYTSGCPKCGRRAELLDEAVRLSCPHCQAKGLILEEIGHWD